MRKNDNWAYLPDYSSQSHTLKFHRQSRNSYSYHSINNDEAIPLRAYVGCIGFIFSFVLLFLFVHDAGF